MVIKYGDRLTIYQKLYPRLHILIQKDIDSYWSEDNDIAFTCPNDQFLTKWYKTHIHFYCLMGIYSGPEFILYTGGIGMGYGYDITFNIDTLKYSLLSVNDELIKSLEYESFEWNDILMKLDDRMEIYRDLY